MKRRTERVTSLIRDTIGEILLSKISDPRIDPALVSVTRVEMPEDLMTARVFVSVMGAESQQRNVLRALQHAAGRIQELMMKQISLRNTPHLEFVEDKTFKKTLETYTLIQKAMQEIREKEEKAKQDSPQSQDEPQGDDASKPPEQEVQE
jgi:ribosome-binding factor A